MIRHGNLADAQRLSQIEAASYPSAEGADLVSIQNRLETFPEHFWLYEKDGEICAMVNGMVTQQSDLTDNLYDHADLHREDGSWQMLFSVVTSPSHRRQGYAAALLRAVIRDCREDHRKGLVLTCKEALIPFYAQFGFQNEGVSASTHGDALWYQMRLTF